MSATYDCEKSKFDIFKMEKLQFKEDPQILLFPIKKEEDKYCMRDDNSELGGKSTQSCVLHDDVKQEFNPENMKESEKNSLDVSHFKIENIKNENLQPVCMKEDFTTEIHGKWKHEDIKYSIDIEEHKVHDPVYNDSSSAKSVSEERNPTCSSSDTGNNLSVLREKRLLSFVNEKKRNGKIILNENYLSNHFQNYEYINTVQKGVKKYEHGCHQKIADTGRLTVHTSRVHTDIKNSECHECHKIYSRPQGLRRHVNVVHKRIKYECDECHKMFSQVDSLKLHVIKVHIGIRNLECIGIKTHECYECHKIYSHAKCLRRHVNEVHKIIKYECDECHKMFSHVNSLRLHVIRVHIGIKNHECIGIKTHECHKCHKIFLKSGDLKQHIKKVHLRTKRFECEDYHKMFSGAGSLTRHIIKVHKEMKKYECGECNKMFSRPSSLKQHINRVHLGTKKYECGECAKMFFRYNGLKKHVNVHINVHIKGMKYKYECNECRKMFPVYANLRQHINGVHIGIKNYQCGECYKMFSQLGNLQQHIDIVHKGIRNYQCDECHKGFCTKYTLRKHIYGVHKRIKTYNCK